MDVTSTVILLAEGTFSVIEALIDVDKSVRVSACPKTDAAKLEKITAPRTDTVPGDAD